MEAARPATTEDIGRLVDLYGAANAELAPSRGGALLLLQEGRRQPLSSSFVAALEDPARGVWAGTIDEFVVGYALARVEQLFDGTRLGVIEDLFVEAEARSVGVGEVLLDAVLAWCKGQNCMGADAVALPGNRATKNFFEAAGFTARLLVMHRKLNGE